MDSEYQDLKVCLSLDYPSLYKGSGMAIAQEHQIEALKRNGVAYTLDPDSNDYQLLHVNSALPRTQALLRKATRKGKRTVCHAHVTAEDFRNSIVFSNYLSPLLRTWLNHLYASADAIICPTSYTKGVLQNNYPKLRHKRIFVQSNGVDMSRWVPDEQRGRDFAQEYRVDGPLVLGVGLVFLRKGVVDFIRSARLLPDVQFLWAGRFRKAWLARNVEFNAELKKLPSNLRFAGFVPDLLGALTRAEIFLFPSHEENEGIAVLEAAAMGKAIVVRDIPVFRSYLTPEVDCLMATTSEGFAEQISRLMADPALRARLGRNARNLALDRSLETVGAGLKTIYMDVLQAPKGQP